MSENDTDVSGAAALKTLDEIAYFHGTDKAIKKPDFPNGLGHGYTPHYQMFFEAFRHEAIKLLEIGVGGGESIKTWLDFFPEATIFGVDKVQNTNRWNTPGTDGRYTFVQGDQSCGTFWKCFIADHGKDWDVIVDDGSHISADILSTYNELWDHVKSNGLYCIEDLKVAPEADQALRSFVDHVQLDAGITGIYFARELCIVRKK